MANQPGEFIWYELLTTDADAAQHFYADVVGWRIADSGMPNMDYRMLHTAQGPIGGLMQLDEGMLAGGARPIWLGYIEVNDVDATASRVTDAGGQVTVSPTDIPEVGRFAMIADPQGIPIYVMSSSSDQGSEAFQAMTDGHCAWNELSTPDPKAALGFYTGQFGWTAGQSMPMGSMGDYQMLDCGDRTIGGLMQADPAGAPPQWRFYFRVPGLAQAMDRVTANGGRILHGPQQVPGDDEILIGMDPQGAVFALVARR